MIFLLFLFVVFYFCFFVFLADHENLSTLLWCTQECSRFFFSFFSPSTKINEQWKFVELWYIINHAIRQVEKVLGTIGSTACVLEQLQPPTISLKGLHHHTVVTVLDTICSQRFCSPMHLPWNECSLIPCCPADSSLSDQALLCLVAWNCTS